MFRRTRTQSLSLSLSCRHGERHGLFLRTGCLPGFRGSCSFVVSSPGSRPIRWFPRRRKESLFFLLFSLLFVFAAWTSPKKNGTTLPLDQVQARIFDPLLSDFSSGENFSSTINYIIIVFDCASYFVIYWTLTSVVLPRRRGPLNGFYPSTYSSSPSLSPTDPHQPPSIFTGRCTAHISVVRRRGNRDPTGAHASERRNNLEETWTDWFSYAKISLNYRVHLYFIIISRDRGRHESSPEDLAPR